MAANPDRHLSKSMLVAVALTIAYLGVMLVLFIHSPIGVFEPKLLLPILNSIFAGAIPIAVAIIAIRSYFASGLCSLLLMASGLMTFGSAAILAGWLIGGDQGPNVNVTIYNVGALMGAVLHALGIFLVLRHETPEISHERKRTLLMWLFLLIYLVLFGLTLAALKGATPLFFIQGTGPTLLRQLVLGSAATLYFLSAVFLLQLFKREQRPFYFWYALSLVMISLGLVAALIQPSVGSPMGWLNRAGHYLAGLYVLTAIWATSRYAQHKSVSFQFEMTALFQQAKMSYETLVETVTEPIVTTDQNFKIIQWNSAAERRFGYSQSEAVGLSLLNLVLTPASAAAFQSSALEIAQATLEKPPAGRLIEITAKQKDTGNLSLEVSLSVARVKGFLLFVSVFRDSTLRKAADETQRNHAEALLKASQARYQSLMSVLPEAIVTQDRDLTIMTWNRAAETILSLSGHQLKALRALDPSWQAVHEDGSAFPLASHPNVVALRTGVPQLNIIMGLCKSDNTVIWVLINAIPVFDEGVVSASSVVVTFTDITERKAVDEELKQHRQHLEQLVLLRTNELTSAKAEADAANHAKSDFLSNMSHELRTPLNALVGLTGLLAQSPLNRRQLDYAENIELSAKTLRTLIDDILDFSKIEANELHLEKAAFSLSALFSNIASVLGVSVGRQPIEPVLDVAPGVPDALIGDALRVQQILLNLISNAVKFTKAGSIVVSVRCITGLNALDTNQTTLAFCVRDSGIGMTDETQGLIFNSFTQANESTSRMYGGTGLGLAISTRLTALMQGQLEVQSTLGLGSEFKLTLPFTLGDETFSNAHRNETLAPIFAGQKVLIVEDHPLARDMLAQTCRQLGWQAHAVDSGASGLQALQNSVAKGAGYDLILLDLHMPGMDGLAMLRELYKSPTLHLPPVVLMVATAEIEQAVVASSEFNINGIVAKPLTPSSLLKVVTTALVPDVEKVDTPPCCGKNRLAGLRLLVAEDNALNQEVIEQILVNAGAQVALVANGQAALEALQVPGARFDAVLMDIQMPVMDGYTATRLIRDSMGLADLPIIALTAHARPQDRERSQLSGMSGHLVKPLDVQDLLHIVAQAVGLRTAMNVHPAESEHALDRTLNSLHSAQALDTLDSDQQRDEQLLHKFVAKQGNAVVAARRHFNSGDSDSAARLLHDLSGVAGFLQVSVLARLASAAEAAILDRQTGNLTLLLDQLQTAMDTLAASLTPLATETPETVETLHHSGPKISRQM
jgi:PAS domain S-box-containing protein